MPDDRDALAEFLMDHIDVGVEWGSPVVDFPGLADAILARWEIVEQPVYRSMFGEIAATLLNESSHRDECHGKDLPGNWWGWCHDAEAREHRATYPGDTGKAGGHNW